MSNDYNGWKGNGSRDSAWATWNVALWVGNEEPLYRARRRMGVMTLDECETFVRECFPGGTPDMDDPSELDDVNWDEIVEHWNAEQEEDGCDEEE